MHAGAIRFVHCGTPCNPFSAARKPDGGPPPLRSRAEPLGLQDLSADNRALVFMGNLFLFRSAEICLVVFNHGGDYSIENPQHSLLWQTPTVEQLTRHTRAQAVDFDHMEPHR